MPDKLPEKSDYSIGIRLTQKERLIALTLGHDNVTQGIKLALAWAAHFYNLGLSEELNLDNVGLVTVSSTDNYITE